MNYNPYDLVPIQLNGHLIYGRPFEFDSEVHDQMNMTNERGLYVVPTTVVACCPDCGAGFSISTSFIQPPFPIIKHSCNCQDEPVIDPFRNPLTFGDLQQHDFDPILKVPTTQEIVEASETVQERLEEVQDFKQPPKPPRNKPRKYKRTPKDGFKEEEKSSIPKFVPKMSKNKQNIDTELNSSKTKLPDNAEESSSSNNEDLMNALEEIEAKPDPFLDKLLDELE
jgi:hypothetical protein